MITQVYLKNFQGTTGRYNLGNLNVISGDNGSGKSTIIKAIQLLLLRTVPCDSVNDIVADQFNYYCGLEGGEMTIEVTTENGSVGRTWSKSKGKVSTKSIINGVDAGANTNFLKAAGVAIFNVQSFWNMTPSQQVNIICELAGIDPAELESLNEKIEQVQTEKCEVVDRVKAASNALKDHEREIQILVEEGRAGVGVNVSKVASEIKEIEVENADIEKAINAHVTGEAKRASDKERLKHISDRCNEIANELELLTVPSNVSTIDLETELRKLDSVKMAFQQRSRVQEKIEKMKGKVQPTPPAYHESDIDELIGKIRDAETGRGVSDSDKMGLEIGRKIFEAIKGLAPVISIEERKQCLLVVSNICKCYKDAVAAGESKAPLEKVREWKTEVERMRGVRKAYDIAHSEWAMNNKEIKTMENDLKELGAIKYDPAYHSKVFRDLEDGKQSAQKVQEVKDKRKRLDDEAARLLPEMVAINERLEKEAQKVDIDVLTAKKRENQTKYALLRESMTGAIEYGKLDELREKKLSQLKELNAKVENLRFQESQLMAKKLELLEAVQQKIAMQCGAITSPASVSIEIPTITKKNRSEKIKFWYKKQNGDMVERSTLCGAECVEFDLALGFALVGEGGVVAAEVAELTRERMDALVQKLSELKKPVQSILIGHTLGRFEVNRNVNYICADKAQYSQALGA